LVIQASYDEPAILHATIALTCAHKRNIQEEQENIILQQYNKAIHNLQQRVNVKCRGSIRVTLIACLIFVCIEYMRGHYLAAASHLESGLNLLKELVPRNQSSDGFIDDSIIETFQRIITSVKVFEAANSASSAIWNVPFLIEPSKQLNSLLDSRNQFDFIITRIHELQHQSNRAQYDQTLPNVDMINTQKNLTTELSFWLSELKVIRKTVTTFYDKMAIRVLHIHHLMAEIMLATSLSLGNELIYDNYTSNFLSITEQVINARREVFAPSSEAIFHPADSSHAIADMGSTAPVYYTAIKCRVRRIRVQAIRLLQDLEIKEAIWDTVIASWVAQKAMDLEEEGDHCDRASDDNFLLEELPEKESLKPPTIPESQRILQVEIELSSEPSKGTGMRYLRCQNNQYVWNRCTYDPASQSWINQRNTAT
jgi:hypothetical protein